MKKVLLVALLVACGTSYGVEYTKEQLNKMIADGKPPKEAEADFSAEKVEFTTCKKSAKEIVAAAGAHYPVQLVSDNAVIYRAKIWANDGSVTVRCDVATGLMTMAQAKYK